MKSIFTKNDVLLRVCSCVLLSLSLSFLIAGCQGDGKSERRILARIGDQIITAGEFNEEFDKVRLEYISFNIQDQRSLNGFKMSFLNRLIEKRILVAEAERRGIVVTRDELEVEVSSIKKDYPGNSFQEILISEYVTYEDWQERIRMKILTEKLINEVILSKVVVEDEEVENYYEAHSEDFLIPKQIRVRQIVVGTEAEAREILQRLRDGEDFTVLAKERSLSPDGAGGGDLGYLSHGQIPKEFDEAVFSLPEGKLSEVVKSPYGFHVFRVEGKRKARKIFLHETYEKIKESLRQNKAEEEYGRWLERIKSKTKIEIAHELLEGED